MKNFILTTLCFVLASYSYAAVFTSVTDGDFNVPATWGTATLPTVTDDVIINHNVTSTGSYSINACSITSSGTLNLTSGIFRAFGDLNLSSGAVINMNSRSMRVLGDAVLNGNITGTSSARFYLQDVNNLSGNTTLDLIGRMYFLDTVTILAGTNISKPQGNISLTGTVINNGTFTGFNFIGTSGSWTNGSFSTLRILGDYNSSLGLTASASENTVIYAAPGTIDQDIVVPTLGRYHYLTIDGDDPASEKRLEGDINILGDLNIDGSTFKAGNTSSFDIEIKGNWFNNDGVFDPLNGFVSFNGTDFQEIDAINGTEMFFDLFISNVDIVETFCNLDVERDLIVSGDLNTGGQNISVGRNWNNSATIELSGGTAIFDENFDGTINGTATFDNMIVNKDSGADAITIGAGTTISITGSVEIPQGILNTNNNLIIVSNPSGTGRIGDLSNATLVGEVEMQRYFDPPVSGWHLLAAPIQAKTLADWDDDLLTTGYPGSDYPDFYFNNTTFYDEVLGQHRDSGLVEATSITQSISELLGWRLYLPEDEVTLKVKGNLFTGNRTFPITYSPDAGDDEDGWNLIANPYPSTIDWDATGTAWTRSGVNNAIYIWDPVSESYTTYVDGVGTNGGSQFIPSSQGFWVQAFQASPSLTIGETAKVPNDVAWKSAAPRSDFFKVAITSPSDITTDLGLRVHENATASFDHGLDAYFLGSTNVNKPAIAVKDAEDRAYSVYSIGTLQNVQAIPLYVKVGQTGVYSFNFNNVAQFKGGTCVRFVDNETGAVTPITDETVVEINLASGEYTDRFTVEMNPAIDVAVKNVDCAKGQDQIEVVLPVDGQWNMNIYDPMGELVMNQNVASGTLETGNLTLGVYNIYLESVNDVCLSTNFNLEIPEQHNMDVELILNELDGDVTNIFAEVAGGVTPYTYNWTTADETASILVTQSGYYGLTVVDRRGCETSTSVEVADATDYAFNKGLSSSIEMTQKNNRLIIEFDLEMKQNFDLNVYNSVGQLMYSDRLNAVQQNRVDVPSKDFKGLTLVVITNRETNESLARKLSF